MYALTCIMKSRPAPNVWDVVSGLLYQFRSQGIDEGEIGPPPGEEALHAANEFEQALDQSVSLPPESFSAYFETRQDAERAQRAIAPHLKPFEATYELSEVTVEDYTEVWRQSFQPIQVPPCWLVRAPWHAKSEDPKIHELVIEPGMAFGTGSHETTRGCLELLGQAVSEWKMGKDATVLDFGCGSGILAIALKKLNVGRVLGVDIDPLSVQATQENAKVNGVSLEVSLTTPQLESLDGIVANILKNTLLEFAPKFRAWIKPGGFLVLSGLLNEQVDTVLEEYSALGFRERRRVVDNEWTSLLLKRS